MTEVFVERHLDAPVTEADMQGVMAMVETCLGVHRVDWRGSLLSADGREMFCHFRAPDAESVRIATRAAGAPQGTAWACEIHDAPGLTDDELAKVNVLVSRCVDELADLEEESPALEAAGAGDLLLHRVRFVRSYRSIDRRRLFCLYHAPDAESVHAARHEAARAGNTAWTVRRFAP